MNKKIHSLALLVNLGIYGVAQAQEPTDTPVSHDDTIVVTAAEQNLQAPGVSTITADEIRKNPVARDVSEIIRTMQEGCQQRKLWQFKRYQQTLHCHQI